MIDMTGHEDPRETAKMAINALHDTEEILEDIDFTFKSLREELDFENALWDSLSFHSAFAPERRPADLKDAVRDEFLLHCVHIHSNVTFLL